MMKRRKKNMNVKGNRILNVRIIGNIIVMLEHLECCRGRRPLVIKHWRSRLMSRSFK